MLNKRKKEWARRGSAVAAFGLAVVLSGQTGFAQEGYVTSLGGPSTGRLVPYFKVLETSGSNLATIIGIENTGLESDFMDVHVVVFNTGSVEQQNFNLCLSEHDFGFIVLQKGATSEAQLEEVTPILSGGNGRGLKVRYLSLDASPPDFSPTIWEKGGELVRHQCSGDCTPVGAEGYVTLSAVTATEPDCSDASAVSSPSANMYVWTILQDVGSGFFATEVPSPAADVSFVNGRVLSADCQVSDGSGGITDITDCLIPANRRVGARYDVNPDFEISTEIIVWLSRMPGAGGGTGRCGGDTSDPGAELCSSSSGSFEDSCLCPAILRGEDEGMVSTTIGLGMEVNLIDPDALNGMSGLKLTTPPQYRGVLEFNMPVASDDLNDPDTDFVSEAGFLFSFVSQAGQNFRETFLGYDTGDTSKRPNGEDL